MEITPVLIRDEDEAGSIWRSEKLKDFEWRIRCLGLEDDSATIQLLQTISDATDKLGKIATKQRNGEYQRKWWQDGEYDADRADCENDKGIEYLKDNMYSEAFESFTEAIRLGPSSAVYHCNRAAAALKLGQPQIAATDSENAIERDREYFKAYIRAGRAYIMLKQPEKTIEYCQQALCLHPKHVIALKYIQEAKELQDIQLQQKNTNILHANGYHRVALSRSSIPEDDAAQALYSAEQMLLVNPHLESAKCAKVEALIACTRYQDALLYSRENLIQGVEKSYLDAEAWWRDGNIHKALINMEGIRLSHRHYPAKCINLEAYLNKLNEYLQRIEEAIADEIYYNAIEVSNDLLATLDPGACCGLYCNVLSKKARAEFARRMFDDALTDLNTSLALQEDHIDSILLRASIYKEQGMYVEYFLDVSALRRTAPQHEQLPFLLKDAAQCCASGGICSGNKGKYATITTCDGSSKSALHILGITSSVTTESDLRRAYLRSASRWHPDKWSAGSEEEKKNAEERFKEIKAAYEAIQSRN